ncbi:4Fe-4S cluster-binding domain-containing protein, partial [Enterococcus faecium]|uniref:4Fe-4S cluster-binding domain-containing protein n=1 Tax=Enterococcus faecium TaxID=1352 RepID=UPI003AAE9028
AQYLIQPDDILNKFQNLDPLSEDSHQPVKGLIHKYENRALIKVSYRCAAHCRFCTRIRQIGTDEGDLKTDQAINNIIHYIRNHPEINDVILSGGDPFYTPKQT